MLDNPTSKEQMQMQMQMQVPDLHIDDDAVAILK